MISTVQAEERVVQERAERQRLDASAEQRIRTIDLFQRNKETIAAMMIQFDTLISEGVYNLLYTGGMGNINVTTAPFTEARLLAQQAYSLQRGGPLPYSDNNPAPAPASSTPTRWASTPRPSRSARCFSTGTCSPCKTSSEPRSRFPTRRPSNTPTPSGGKAISEKRIKRYGKAVDLFERDTKTRMILEKLEEPISMSFAEDTPLEDVLKYIKQATTTANYQGIPIYVDPIGLQEAEKSMTSTVRTWTSKACL